MRWLKKKVGASGMIQLINFTVQDGSKILLDHLNLELQKPFKLGIMGESGSGKSTLAKALVRLIDPKLIIHGELRFKDLSIYHLDEKKLREIRKDQLKYLVQEPYFALNPYLKIRTQLKEAFKNPPTEADLIQSLNTVGLEDPLILNRYPYQLSGGQRQRIALLQALVSKPSVLIADEPTTALDPLLQKTILSLISGYTEKTQSSLVFISHDLEALVSMTDQIIVMYGGRIVERLLSKDLFTNAKHPYTQALVACVIKPGLDPTPIIQRADALSQGCPFAPFCPKATKLCFKEKPEFITDLACHHAHNPESCGVL